MHPPIGTAPNERIQMLYARADGASETFYNAATLKLYNTVVLGISNDHFWRCPTGVMEAAYTAYAGAQHLDIGPGTGHYLAHLPDRTVDVTLVDANLHSLDAAAALLAGAGRTHRAVQQSVFDPLPGEFDSISANYLFHCIDDDAKWDKATRTIADALRPHGTFFGATIMPVSRPGLLDAPGRLLNAAYNAVGVFTNENDDEDRLAAALGARFDEVQINRRGWVVHFAARQPRPHRKDQ
ncbi:class I SAM-dependent methyltransferase [Tsukamurella ocularis]|uniref:class I SAM-dependent methyltransferase n=1 Tax=Tsukamurella ocularis TaxID=1970234 RepID=UPI002169EFC4|nr:class I SAM-dependent methyltransferase [Tsukamurella ocularis]MCS3779401.1 SAM-dependent methyltransferase [Tsukamurella ocularis]MCS3789869.1 SAM-dependent methyltransferase [Tsukamurella ocularis]